MILSELISKQLREVYLDGQFIANTNLKDQILDLTYSEATYQVGDLNTIAALAFHLNYYLEGVLNVFNGGALEIRDKFSFDFDPPQSEGQWNTLRTSLIKNAEKMAIKIEMFTNDQFNAHFVDEKYGSLYRNVHGLIEHGYYHLGQIVIIKKMIRGK